MGKRDAEVAAWLKNATTKELTEQLKLLNEKKFEKTSSRKLASSICSELLRRGATE